MVINTRHVMFTGKKWKQKVYRHHTGYDKVTDILLLVLEVIAPCYVFGVIARAGCLYRFTFRIF